MVLRPSPVAAAADVGRRRRRSIPFFRDAFGEKDHCKLGEGHILRASGAIAEPSRLVVAADKHRQWQLRTGTIQPAVTSVGRPPSFGDRLPRSALLLALVHVERPSLACLRPPFAIQGFSSLPRGILYLAVLDGGRTTVC